MKVKKTLIFNNGINTSLFVYDLFSNAGYPIAHLDNTASKKERTQILKWFKEYAKCHSNLGEHINYWV